MQLLQALLVLRSQGLIHDYWLLNSWYCFILLYRVFRSMFSSLAALLLLKFTFFSARRIISYSASMLAPFSVVSETARGVSTTSSMVLDTCCTAAGSGVLSNCSLL